MILLLQTVESTGVSTLAIIFTAIPLTIASVTTMIVTIRNGGKAQKAVQEVKEDLVVSGERRDATLEGLRKQNVEIHELVNGDMTRAIKKIEQQRVELVALIEEHKRLLLLVQKLQQLILDKGQ